MASFIERVMYLSDYETDGGPVDLDEFENCLVLFETNALSNVTVRERFASTTPQRNQIQAILDTMPTSSLTLTILTVGVAAGANAQARARWARSVRAILNCGRWSQDPATNSTYFDNYDTAAKVQSALGI